MPVAAYIENGTMFVPLRPLSQAFQADMIWDSSTNTAKIEDINSFFTEKIEQKTLKNKRWYYSMGSKTILSRIERRK